MKAETQVRIYKRAECAVFSKTKEEFGGLSNMAAGFPLRVNGVDILTSEALYQACRFPHLPKLQRLIIRQLSPMTAKMKGKPYRKDSRTDWEKVRVKIMRWCLRVKLAQNWTDFSQLLISTGEGAIVEESRKDDFWGAKVIDEDTLIGMNVLGRLLMELREEVKHGDSEQFSHVDPLPIPDFLLYGEPILAVGIREAKTGAAPRSSMPGEHSVSPYPRQSERIPKVPHVEQPSLFDSAHDAGEITTRSGAMVDGLKPYPEYQESGVPWLSRVPVHWTVSRIKTVLRELDYRSADGSGVLLSLTRLRGLIPHSDMTNKMHSAKTLAGYKRYRPGQIVMNRMQAWSGMFGAGSMEGLVSPDYAVFEILRAHEVKLVLERLKAPDLVGQFALESKGIGSGFNRLYTDRFGPIPISLPPADEQAAVVRFLDHANRRLERTIRAKRNVIALLSEQKQAIIHRAVTRGLDPTVPFKPSGIPWLGDIPKHWEVRRLRHLIVGRLTYGANAAAEHDNRDWPRYLRITDFRMDGSLRPDTFRSLPPDVAKDYFVESGDILLARSGATVGKAFLVEPEADRACHAGYLIRARPNTDLVTPKFLFAFTQSAGFREWKDCTFKTATIQNIGADKYANLPVPLPPTHEQSEILQFIRIQTDPLNAVIGRTEREIALLREYCTRLTADVVTGKLDVREAARRLPAEAGGLDEPLDAVVLAEGDEGAEGTLDE